ncbi:MAG: hypothetical protein L6Q37_14360 [Bdellovibrionaceae bacterium]|nr:hypothetical protein [Pseudobdellovibrionaceae bacterium]NUM58025.1 hypothetical protein [Pseudobdellovibrionaceae bacterium]
MKKYWFFIFFFSLQSFSTETVFRRYLSQQDVIKTLLSIFSLPYQVEVLFKEHSACKQIPASLFEYPQIPLELGFVDLDSGDTSMTKPDSGYILYFEKCIDSLYLTKFPSPYIPSESNSAFFTPLTLKKVHAQAQRQQIQDYNQLDFSLFEESLKLEIIQAVFLKVFGDTQMFPQELFKKSITLLTQVSDKNRQLQKPIFFQQAVLLILKSSIISEQFLSY